MAQPSLDCRVCQASFEKGDAATPEGLTVYDGVDPETFQCRDCPFRAVEPLDETSQLALVVWNLLTPMPEGTTTVEVVFKILDIPYPSRQAAELYQRVALIGHLSQEHATQQRKRPPGTQEDLLAGMADDDDED